MQNRLIPFLLLAAVAFFLAGSAFAPGKGPNGATRSTSGISPRSRK